MRQVWWLVLLVLVAIPVEAAVVRVLKPSVEEARLDDENTTSKTAYFSSIRKQIQRRADQEQLPRSRGGTVKVSLTLNKDGQIKAVTIKESSGNLQLDQLALRIIQEAAPFGPFPQALAQDEFECVVPMSFPVVPGTVLDWLFD